MWGLRVDPEDLEAWSVQCMTAAVELAARVPVVADLPSGQATAAAVGVSQTIAATAVQLLAVRVQATGEKASSAVSSYLRTDEDSAQRLAAVASGPVVV